MRHLIILLCLMISAAAINAQEVIATSNINLRSGASQEASIVYQIPKGTQINLEGCKTSWCEVSVDGHSGYIAKRYTSTVAQATSNQAHPTGTVKYYQNSKGNIVQSPTYYDKTLLAPPLCAMTTLIVSVRAVEEHAPITVE